MELWRRCPSQLLQCSNVRGSEWWQATCMQEACNDWEAKDDISGRDKCLDMISGISAPVIRWLNIPSIIAFTSFSIFLFNPMFFNFLTDSVRLSAAPNQQSQQEQRFRKVERAVMCDRPERDIRVRIYKISLWTDLVSPSDTPARLLVQSVVMLAMVQDKFEFVRGLLYRKAQQ